MEPNAAVALKFKKRKEDSWKDRLAYQAGEWEL